MVRSKVSGVYAEPVKNLLFFSNIPGIIMKNLCLTCHLHTGARLPTQVSKLN